MDNILIAYPKNLPRRDHLIDFYDSYINTLLQYSKAKCLHIVSRPGAKSKIDSFKAIGSNYGVEVIPHQYKNLQDIWCRDYMPINYNNKFFKFKYQPSYYKPSERYCSDNDDKVANDLCKMLGLNKVFVDYILDGGNYLLINNDVFFTYQAVVDNKTTPVQKLAEVLKTNVYLLPVEEGDVVGHTDGSIRFIDDKLVYDKNSNYYNNLRNYHHEFTDYNGVGLHGLSQELVHERVPEAYGNYVNMFIFNKVVFFPLYGITNDKANLDKMQEEFKDYTFIGVNCEILSRLGGVLNCITWEF